MNKIELEELIEKEGQAALDRFSQSSIRKEIEKRIDANIDQTIKNVIGLDYSWNRVEVDHCNGRMSMLTKVVEGTAEQILKNKIDEYIPSLQLSVAEQNAIKKELHTKFKELLIRKLDLVINNKVEEYINILITDKLYESK